MTSGWRAWALAAPALVWAAAPAAAQSVISAQSGVIHYTEGRVLLGDKAVEPKFGEFPNIKEGGVLRTEEGRAEVLLTPGVFLRAAEDTAVRMISSRLVDTRLELERGTVLLECLELPKDNAVTFVVGGAAVSLRKQGLYRLDASPARLRVYDGEAVVESGGGRATVKRGGQVMLEGVLAAGKFDHKSGDALYRWSKRRSEYVALANLSGSKSLLDRGMGWTASGWHWNPYFGLFTFVPYRGTLYSPFGYAFWSPRTVVQIYNPPVQASRPSFSPGGSRSWAGGYDAGTAPRSSGVYSVPSSAPGAGAASPAPAGSGAAASPRGGESVRDSSGGGRGR